MSFWGPFHRKVLRAIKFRTWLPARDGTYIQKEAAGPANFDQYTVMWKVFVVACLMTRHVTEFALDIYYKNLAKLMRLWPECWHLVYEADDNMRAEHIERIQRKVATDIARGGAPPDHWDPAAPWTACFLLAANDTD